MDAPLSSQLIGLSPGQQRIAVTAQRVRKPIISLLSILTERELLAYEMLCRDNCTQDEIAAALHIDQSNVSRLFETAKAKVRACEDAGFEVVAELSCDDA